MQDYDIEIEKGIPVPTVEKTSKRWPFVKMEAGDSFAITEPEYEDITQEEDDLILKRLRGALTSSANSYGRRHNKKFAVRRVGPRSFRCWRTE